MGKIESPKVYNGKEMTDIFLRPIMNLFNVKSKLNFPLPTKAIWWNNKKKHFKDIELNKVRMDISYSADDYFNLVYDTICNERVDVGQLTGVELEKAEVAILQNVIKNKLANDAWNGDNGFISKLQEDDEIDKIIIFNRWAENVAKLFEEIYDNASNILKDMKLEGKLKWYVSPNIYTAYSEYLDDLDLEYMSTASNNIAYKGILLEKIETDKTFILLTDERNLCIAVNSIDKPDCEVRLWYNPDTMENKQRIVLFAGYEYMLPELISFGHLTE